MSPGHSPDTCWEATFPSLPQLLWFSLGNVGVQTQREQWCIPTGSLLGQDWAPKSALGPLKEYSSSAQ